MFVPEHRLTNWSKIAFARSEILLITDRICFLKETGSGENGTDLGEGSGFSTVRLLAIN